MAGESEESSNSFDHGGRRLDDGGAEVNEVDHGGRRGGAEVDNCGKFIFDAGRRGFFTQCRLMPKYEFSHYNEDCTRTFVNLYFCEKEDVHLFWPRKNSEYSVDLFKQFLELQKGDNEKIKQFK